MEEHSKNLTATLGQVKAAFGEPLMATPFALEWKAEGNRCVEFTLECAADAEETESVTITVKARNDHHLAEACAYVETELSRVDNVLDKSFWKDYMMQRHELECEIEWRMGLLVPNDGDRVYVEADKAVASFRLNACTIHDNSEDREVIFCGLAKQGQSLMVLGYDIVQPTADSMMRFYIFNVSTPCKLFVIMGWLTYYQAHGLLKLGRV